MNQKLNCILLIDDDEPTNFLSNMLLEEANCAHHIQTAESGQNALDYLSKTAYSGNGKTALPFPELIFLDINMPAMNGWEFLEEYKEWNEGRHPNTIIIMLTTSINPDDKVKAENIPLVAAFENKPLTSNMIQRVIKKYFIDRQD